MALAPGVRLGAYEIVALIGAGGMGEVYRARDTRLDRTVAVKVLPPHLATDPQFRARFEHEARAVAALSHPHICVIHDVGRQEHIDYLVMEYLEGQTLAERLAKGALPLDDALQIAIQIAEALAAAHRAGIVHRDLKPGNVMLTKAGLKLLDFGLAKTRIAAGVAADLTMLPTTPPGVTVQGTILGTFQYMAPEQLEGGEADARTDIFAFGAVLYEMLAGTKAFEGKSQANLIAAILERDPQPLGSVQPLAPKALDRTLRKCLAKNPEERWQSAADVADELRWIGEAGAASGVSGESQNLSAPIASSVLHRTRTVPWIMAAVSLVVVGIVSLLYFRQPRMPLLLVTRFTITPTSGAAMSVNGTDPDVAITPDGSHIVYVGSNGTQLFARAIDALEPVVIARGSPREPFVSPDGQSVAYIDNQAVKQVAIRGGPVVTLASHLDDALPRGATFAANNTIIFANGKPTTGLQRLSLTDGTSTVLTRPDRAKGEANHFWPETIPGRNAVLFTIMAQAGGLDAAQIAVLDLTTGQQKTLIPGGSHGHYVTSGHLMYAAGGALRAVAFDVARLETRGTPVTVIPQVLTMGTGGLDAVVADDGTLVYVPGGIDVALRRLVWVDRQGHETPIALLPRRLYAYPRLSPSGNQIITVTPDTEYDLWLWDLVRMTSTRVTFDPSQDSFPVWTPDGRKIIFTSARFGPQNLFIQAADGTGTLERLTDSPNDQVSSSMTADGTRLIFSENTPATGSDLMMLRLDATRRVEPLVKTPANERNGEISPDGRWLAYASDESGQPEIYVRPFPDVNTGRWQVSTGGGTRPLWARNGEELFYLAPDGGFMRAGVERGPIWVATAPAKVLDGSNYSVGGFSGRSYDISADGKHFLMTKAGDGPASAATSISLVVVQHWDEELKRLVPAN